MARRDIFTAGPAVLPESVLAALSRDVLEWEGSGQSVLELSHRSEAYVSLQDRAERALASLLGLDEGDRILFLQGGASQQFAMAPLNLLGPRKASGDYIVTGAWSQKALAEARRLGAARLAGSSEAEGFRGLPGGLDLDPGAAYVHYTSNNTIYGTQWPAPPEAGDDLVCDASSDLLSRPVDRRRHKLIYAGAQKNCGAAGVTLVILRKDAAEEVLASEPEGPVVFHYKTHLAKDSRFNTPPVFAVLSVLRVSEWLLEQGGLAAMAERNERKAARLYALIDEVDLYEGVASPEARSRMNVCFRLREPERQAALLAAAAEHGFVGLAGHRSVGGLRASLYNALPEAAVERLCAFLAGFAAGEN